MLFRGRIPAIRFGLFALLMMGIANVSQAQTQPQGLPRILMRPNVPTAVRPVRPIPTAPQTTEPTPTDPQPTEQQPVEASPEPQPYTACNANKDCPRGECWDGVCCNVKCNGNCVSCRLPGHEGTCTQVPNGQDPRRACCSSVGGHPSCIATCLDGQCTWPDIGVPCDLCMGCDGTGRCTQAQPDDARCGKVTCQGLNSYCRKYQDIEANRCAGAGACKAANDPATCVNYTVLYSGVDPAGVRRECTTGKAMNCYETPSHHMVWQDGPVIRYCTTGEVCRNCPPPQPTDPADPADQGPAKLRGQ